jgi:hypothetical protein
MADNRITFYEVLGVPRDAKATDIGRAYNRIKSDALKESAAPNPRGLAMAKVAFDTLMDPARRAEYDASLQGSRVAKAGGGGRRGGLVAISLIVVVLGAAGFGYYYFTRVAARPADKAPAPQDLLASVSPYLGRLQSAMMSGEVRELGTAVAVRDNEMVTTCRGLVAGAALSVLAADLTTSKADLARANEDLDICTLSVKGAAAGIKLREGLPAAGEKIQAIVLNATGPSQVRNGSVARSIPDEKGAVLELKVAAPLPNGTPIFDSQSRLVGIVTTPHAHGEGVVVALPGSRIVQARGPAAAVAAAAPTAATSPSASSPAPIAVTQASPPESAAASPAPTTRRGSRGTLEEEGFSSLWKEDSDMRLVEVLDNLKKGTVGNPMAYWTRWSGRDPSRAFAVHCLVTFGAQEQVVMDYAQPVMDFPSDGYWYCAIVGDDLQNLEEGPYHFTIFVDGQKVAENTIRIEKRFFTRGTIAVIVLIVGLGLLGFLRRNKVVSYSDKA